MSDIEQTEADVLAELRKRNSQQVIGPRHDPQGRCGLPAYDTEQVQDRAPEEHVYLVYVLENGGRQLWEADLIGDQSKDAGFGELPPVVDIECPFCSKPGSRHALTVTAGNKHYEIETVSNPKIETWPDLRGNPRTIVFSKVLTVREPIRCPWCQIRFTIKGNMIEKVIK